MIAIGESEGAYPELSEKKDYILKVIAMEEERFDATIDAGLAILSNLIRRALTDGVHTISGEEVFKLYDTFGFPIDLTREILEEQNLDIDEQTFKKLMEEQKVRARTARANISGWSNSSKSLIAELPKTEFTGYGETVTDGAKVVAILVEDESVERVTEGSFTLVLDKTPFYGEGGGQVGDTGTIYDADTMITVTDTKKADGVYLHLCTLVNGDVKVGDIVRAEVDAMRRAAIMRNHSTAHLLQAALRQILGTHVEQAGSYVDEEHVRFDFTHYAALTAEELEKVEGLVNAHILVGLPIVTTETDIETAKKNGAMALFGEKYGATVRMVKMGSFSTELCGGTHLDNTAKVGLFKITSEASVSAGVRRIEGVTGLGVLKQLKASEVLVTETAKELKVQKTADLAKRATQLQAELSAMKKEIETLNAKIAASGLDSIMAGAETVGSVRLVTSVVDGMQLDAARSLADEIKARYDDTVAVLALNADGKLSFIAVAGKAAVAAGAHAGKLVGAVAAVTGGKGGGRPDNAMAGGRDASAIGAALASAKETLSGMLK